MARAFFAHRQRRWLALARQQAQDPTPLWPPLRRGDLVRALIDAGAQAAPRQRWPWLEAAHVVGQASLPLHFRVHAAMLALAWQTRDVREVVGQLARLALLVPGHLLQRLPSGNPGRARVSAFAPMALETSTVQRIRAATAALKD
ncbi:MAG: DUF3703 domain-containing protein [Ramlibacter sp.]|nr:DUF3703 domain-containing protein [Ramlibacter sp.]